MGPGGETLLLVAVRDVMAPAGGSGRTLGTCTWVPARETGPDLVVTPSQGRSIGSGDRI